tara:strand:- start:102 stop:431 length:330 start_codon:yes stop_codon:yes gene_type:complete
MGKRYPRVCVPCPECDFENYHRKKSRNQICDACGLEFCIDCFGAWSDHTTGGKYECHVVDYIREREQQAEEDTIYAVTEKLEREYCQYRWQIRFMFFVTGFLTAYLYVL